MKPKLAPCNGTLSPRTIAHYNGTCNGTTPQSGPSPSPPLAHYNGTLQWHPAMATRPLHPAMAPSTSKWVITRLAHYTGTCNGTTPSPTIAHYNGTLQWHHVHSPKSSSQPQYTTMAPYNGTLQWHHVHCTLQWHLGVTSNPPKWFVALPPIGSKNPYSYRYLGNQESHHAKCSPPKNQYTRHMSKKMSW